MWRNGKLLARAAQRDWPHLDAPYCGEGRAAAALVDRAGAGQVVTAREVQGGGGVQAHDVLVWLGDERVQRYSSDRAHCAAGTSREVARE